MSVEFQDSNTNTASSDDTANTTGASHATRSVEAAPEPVARPEAAPAPAPVARPGVLLTAETFKQFAPRAKPELLAVIADKGNEVLARFGINANANRLCHFLAQVSHECAGFSQMEENLNYSVDGMVRTFGPGKHSARITAAEARRLVGNKEAFAERVYGLGNPTMARRLGNTQPGDGYRYRGRGFMQITGRANYRTMGNKIGVDLEANPDLAAQPLYALMTAAAFWDNKGLNRHADADKIEVITKLVNGGHSGLAHRKSSFAAAKRLWGQGSSRSIGMSFDKGAFGGRPPLEYGDLGPEVLDLKKRLARLGYDGLPMDESFGAATHVAVVRFKLARGLPGDGVVDAETWETLDRETDGPVTRGVSSGAAAAEDTRRSGGSVRLWGFILLIAAVAVLAARYLIAGGLAPPASAWEGLALAFAALVALAGIVLMVLGGRIARASRDAGEPEFDEWGIRPGENAEAA